MTIYIECVLIDNLIIDSLILLTCQKISKNSTTKLKVFLSSLLGAVIALFSPLFPSFVNLLIKPFVAVLMVIVAFRPTKIKKILINTILLFFVTFLYGGAMIGIMEILNIEFTLTNGVNYVNNFPIGLALLFCAITYIALKNIITYCSVKQKNSQFLYTAMLTEGAKQISITAFLDTGNCIVKDGKPVTIINFKTFNMLFPTISITDILLKKNLPIKNQTYTEINSLSNMNEKILLFEIDSLSINKRETKDALLGLSLINFNKKTNSDAIISNMILGD